MRNGVERWRLRLDGRDYQLPLPPGGGTFVAKYEAVMAGAVPGYKSGTLGWLITRFYASRAHKELGALTRKDQCSTLDWILDAKNAKGMKCCDVRIATMDAKAVQKLMDLKVSEAPAGKTNKSAANKVRKYTSVVFNYAIREGWAQSNPTTVVKRETVDGDGYTMWPQDQVKKYRECFLSGTRERLALELAIYTGLARVDLVKATRANVVEGRLEYRRKKTGVAGTFPIHPNLQRELDQVPDGQLMLLLTQYGKPFTPDGFGRRFEEWRARAEIAPGLSFHGLRKRGATDLAEAGATVPEIMAFLNDRSEKMAILYVQQADKKRLGDRAVARLK